MPRLRLQLCVPLVVACTTACGPTMATVAQPGPNTVSEESVQGANLAGANLAGSNLTGSNLAGANLAGANLGGTNLAGANLAGTNLAGTNLGGNNLGGNNLAGSNLAGTNLAGTNLAGTNLAGTNLAGSNLAGSNLAGTNLAGNNLAGTNLAGANLATANIGKNIHGLAATTGLLMSGEDLMTPRTGTCVVMGIGSTAFAKLVNQNKTGTKMYAALSQLNWGFAATSGGAMQTRAWEAVVWGAKTYCVFVLSAPLDATFAGVAGFVKSIWRWNAPQSMSMDIGQIGGGQTVATYPGMMGAYAPLISGVTTAQSHVGAELAFITATVNTIAVNVDFAAWVLKADGTPLPLGNISGIPLAAEGQFTATMDSNNKAHVYIHGIDSGLSPKPWLLNPPPAISDTLLLVSLQDDHCYADSTYPRVIPKRCVGARALSAYDPVPVGKCDSIVEDFPYLGWYSCPELIPTPANWPYRFWDAPNTGQPAVLPYNTFMQFTPPFSSYDGVPLVETTHQTLGETYVHTYEVPYTLCGNAVCEGPTETCSTCAEDCCPTTVVKLTINATTKNTTYIGFTTAPDGSFHDRWAEVLTSVTTKPHCFAMSNQETGISLSLITPTTPVTTVEQGLPVGKAITLKAQIYDTYLAPAFYKPVTAIWSGACSSASKATTSCTFTPTVGGSSVVNVVVQ